jgi:non-specific serine/threonine protein kinase
MQGRGQQVVGDFRLERLIAGGGTSLVYEARDLSRDRRVALKLIAPEASADAAYRERFVREARATLRLKHHNIVPVYRAAEADGKLFIAMRLIEGEDLKQIIDVEGPLPAERVLRIVRQIAGGLDAAHASGLVHRDLKPSNVLVEHPGQDRERCYVADFGLAVEQDASSIMSGVAWSGTPGYVSPEQLRSERVDARTDVYALGVLVFHALAGRTPYAREHVSGTLLAHLHAPPPSLTELRGDMPREVDAVIARALAKAPGARYASAAELAGALEEALAGNVAASDGASSGAGGLARPLGNLRADAPSLVGRRRELSSAIEALEGCRLLSFVGAGGVGKTTLAVHLARNVASDYAGVWVLELDSLQNAAGLELALARALGLQIGLRGSIRGALVEFIEERRFLLVLDNCEHMLADAASVVGELLAACPRLTIVATTREPLALEGERVHPLGPLEVPSDDDYPEDVLASDSAHLLLLRASEHGLVMDAQAATARAIARICARLEGIPLALELAAARLRTLSLSELERRLQDDLGVLARAGDDGPERQRTLDDLIEWSWRLLAGNEREVLSRLAVCAGPFTLDAAEAVALTADRDSPDAGALVLKLADKSLLQVDANRPEPRFRMLQPVREFCDAHPLGSARPVSARAAHRAYYLALVECAKPELDGARAAEWLTTLDEDQPNIRAAIENALRDDDAQSALRMGVAMRQYWACRGRAGEGIELLTMVLRDFSDVTEMRLRAQAQSSVAHLAAGRLGDTRLAEPHAVEALELARAAGDADTAAEALIWLSWSHSSAGRATEGLALAREGLLNEGLIEDPTVLGRLLDAQAVALENLDEVVAARAAYERARDVFAKAGYAPGVASVENHLGDLDLSSGDAAGAAAHFALARTTAERAGDGAAVALAALNLALVEHLEGRGESARELFVDCLITNQACGDQANIAFSVFGLALTERDEARAAELHGSADRRLDRLDLRLSALETRLQKDELERLSVSLGVERFDRARERGERLQVEDVIAMADVERTAAG